MPKIQQYKSSKNVDRGDHPETVFDDLYVKKDYTKIKEVNTDDVEFEKNKKELTFKPNTGSSKQMSQMLVKNRPFTAPIRKTDERSPIKKESSKNS